MAVPKMSLAPLSPYRPKNRTSDKMIFISCEGSVTEWEYFEKIVNAVFANVKTKVTVINILEDILKKRANKRTSEEANLASQSKPENLLKKMNDFKELHKDEYSFSDHPDDEFWLIMDVDDHTDPTIVNAQGISNEQKWNNVLSECREKNYSCAISNPFFELWLLLHFDDVNDDDKDFAVTESHSYEPTTHYTERLKDNKIRMTKKGKGIDKRQISQYTKERIKNAISRARILDTPPCEDYPHTLGTTVYKLLESIAEIDSKFE